MSWYYAENNERRGPIEEAAFQSLVNAGTIQPDTLVWRDGLADWMAYRSVPSTVSTPVVSATTTPGSAAVACSQCGRLFPADETLTFEGRNVCAQCKPLFFQKVKEGAMVVGQQEYGGFWIRFCAKFVDGFILNLAGRLLGLGIGAAFGGSSTAVQIAVLVGLLLNAGYSIFFTGKYGATPGKMACKLQIIRTDGSPLTYGRATARYFAEFLSFLLLGIGYFMVAFDEEKRSLHDRICDTRVVRTATR